jgi:hypothetical protein
MRRSTVLSLPPQLVFPATVVVYFATAVSYASKMFETLAPGDMIYMTLKRQLYIFDQEIKKK